MIIVRYLDDKCHSAAPVFFLSFMCKGYDKEPEEILFEYR